ncbi:hypothetical protein RM863_35255 [Streptomyces sp. DSM 41014]|uniref:Scaffolding protein n=1 Tax=Streptomyces hintoniae TaxID=3075521 RepID=A0ABU2UVS4_9ACTN|nr:hypothetical protein [Streptomyces sp. DSM 41014]MDT0477393.1 hypothetical protein [Streptomyces sp. DSM 41014]
MPKKIRSDEDDDLEQDDVEVDDDGDQDDVDDGQDDDGDQDPEGADQLGDAGKKALDTMKGRHRAERERRKAVEAELATLKAGQSKKADAGDDVVDAEAIRAQARAEARAEGLRERALDRLEARAARQFANPEVARRLLSDRVDEFVDGDRVDVEAISDALEDLLRSDPYLGSEQAAQAAKRFKDSGDGGPRGKGPKGQVTEAELAGMTPSQIVAAKKEGRLNNLLGVTKK